MPLPVCKISAQAIEVEIRERVFGAVKISHGPVKNGTGAGKVLARLVMEGDGHLNHALQMPAQWGAAGRLPPGVFKRLVCFEKASLIQEGQAIRQLAMRLPVDDSKAWQRVSPGLRFLIFSTT